MLAVLAQIDAGLGRKEQAVAKAAAVDLMPISKDAYDGPLVLRDWPRFMFGLGKRSARWK
jgi:hypothetical protein